MNVTADSPITVDHAGDVVAFSSWEGTPSTFFYSWAESTQGHAPIRWFSTGEATGFTLTYDAAARVANLYYEGVWVETSPSVKEVLPRVQFDLK